LDRKSIKSATSIAFLQKSAAGTRSPGANQPPLKRFKLLAQDTLKRTSSKTCPSAVADFDTDLQAYLSASMSYTSSSGLDLWIDDRQCAKFSQLAQLAQDLLAAPASEAYVERVFSVCGDLTSGKRNRLTKNLHMRAFLKLNRKFYV
jgi:hypothetical protein